MVGSTARVLLISVLTLWATVAFFATAAIGLGSADESGCGEEGRQSRHLRHHCAAGHDLD